MAHTIGSIPAWMTVVVVAIIGYILLRGGSGTAVRGLQDTNRALVHQVHGLTEENKSLRARVTKLESETNVTLAIVPVLKAMETHETNAEVRTQKTLAVLGMIADHLGSEKEG